MLLMFDIIKSTKKKPEGLSIIIFFKNSSHSFTQKTLIAFLKEDPVLCQRIET